MHARSEMSVFVMTEHFISLGRVQTANRQAICHLPISRFDALTLRRTQHGESGKINMHAIRLGTSVLYSEPNERVNQHKG